MANQVKYGVISDIHQDPRIIVPAINVLKHLGAEKLLVNGDIAPRQDSLEESQKVMAGVLNAIGESELESFVQPGSQETLFAYQPVVDCLGDKYENIFSVNNPVKVEDKNHDLVFLPGTDWFCGGEYIIGKEEIPTGNYLNTKDQLYEAEDIKQIAGALEKGLQGRPMHFSNMQDLEEMVSNPEKTIMVCYIPRKFDNTDYGVDMAEFGEATQNFSVEGNPVKKGSIFPMHVAKRLHQQGYQVQVQLKKENRGNEDLKSLYEKLGINKAVSGHFHESGHRAHDSNCNPVQQETPVNELFWNSGHLDAGQTGILTVEDYGMVSYQNVDLRDYIKSK